MSNQGFFDLMDTLKESFKPIEDPLIIHNPENKSKVLTSAIKVMNEKNHIFYPAPISNPTIFGGHLQTILTEIKDENFNLNDHEKYDFAYDLEETFTFKDGGQTLINYKFHPVGKDMLYLFSGQVGSN